MNTCKNTTTKVNKSSMSVQVKRPSNLEEIRARFDALPFGSRRKLAKKHGVSPRYVTEVTKKGSDCYNYAIIKDAIRLLPEEIREGLKLEFK